MDKRYQVFISSTFEDLKEERQAALKGILELGHMPAGMELFPAADAAAWQLIQAVIDESDYYVLIVGGRYGSLDETGLGYTEKEYDYAVQNDKPIIALLHADPDNLPRGKTEQGKSAWQKLQRFRKKTESKHTCGYWKTADELKTRVVLGMTAAIRRCPMQGWVRTGALSSQEASEEIIRLRKTVDQQREQLERIGATPPEGAEHLSQGDDLFAVDFDVTLSKDTSDWRDPKRIVRETQSVSVTWDALFGAFASNLIHPWPETKIRSDIARYLKERAGDSLQVRPRYTVSHISISDSAYQTLKVQFLALGWIETHVERRETKTGEKDISVCELTPLGRRQLYKVKAIYRTT